MVLNVMEAQKSHFVGKIELNNQNVSELQENLWIRHRKSGQESGSDVVTR